MRLFTDDGRFTQDGSEVAVVQGKKIEEIFDQLRDLGAPNREIAALLHDLVEEAGVKQRLGHSGI